MDLRSLRITCQNVSWLIICKQLKGRYIQRWVASLHTVAQIMPENKCVLIRQSVSQEARVFSVVFCFFVFLAGSLWTSFSLLSPAPASSACSCAPAVAPSSLGVFRILGTGARAVASSHVDCPRSAPATWLDIFCGYYRFLQSKPLSTRQEKWDLNSGELQGHSGALNSSIRLCQRERNCRTKGNRFPAEFRETAHSGWKLTVREHISEC